MPNSIKPGDILIAMYSNGAVGGSKIEAGDTVECIAIMSSYTIEIINKHGMRMTCPITYFCKTLPSPLVSPAPIWAAGDRLVALVGNFMSRATDAVHAGEECVCVRGSYASTWIPLTMLVDVIAPGGGIVTMRAAEFKPSAGICTGLAGWLPPEGSAIFATRMAAEDAKCLHKYKQYQGLTEAYEYCENCDEKRQTT